MANPKHLAILQQGTEVWNTWRNEQPPDLVPDLSWADIPTRDLSRANFARAHLRKTTFARKAILRSAIFWKADLVEAELYEADLREANLRKAILFDAKLNGANLSGANLTGSLLVDTHLENADLTGTFVYGCSVWDAKLDGAIQRDLVIIDKHSSFNEWKPGELTDSLFKVDGIEMAQFIYLLRADGNIRSVIDTMTSKLVLILGRFTAERRAVLDAIRDRLRDLKFVPVIFDFERPTQRDFTETIKTLAGLSRFIIADITNPRSSPLELQALMPDYMIPFVPIIHEKEEPFAMFRDLDQKHGGWVLDLLKYDSTEDLLKVLDEAVVRPALEMADELTRKKAAVLRTRHVKDYMQGA
jgi:hypothetical protein